MFLLDAHDNVYVWLGHEARQDEKRMAMDAALVSLFLLITTTVDGQVSVVETDFLNILHLKYFMFLIHSGAGSSADSLQLGSCHWRTQELDPLL